MTSKTTWWNSSARNLVYARWGFLVLINALLPFFLAFQLLNGIAQFIGMILAVASFIVIYAEFDVWLINKHYSAFSKQLRVSAAIKTGTPLLPFIDMFTGMISMAVTQALTGFNLEQLTRNIRQQRVEDLHIIDPSPSMNVMLTYFTTMVNGVLLTLLVGLVLMILRIIQAHLAKRRTGKLDLNSAASR